MAITQLHKHTQHFNLGKQVIKISNGKGEVTQYLNSNLTVSKNQVNPVMDTVLVCFTLKWTDIPPITCKSEFVRNK